MFKTKHLGGYIFACFVAAAMTVQGERLEPVLRARAVTGTVSVQRAGEDRFQPVEDGRTYPYGSRFRTSSESSVRLAMSDESSVLVLASTEMLFTESRRDANVKTVRLFNGEVEPRLGPSFRDAGYKLYVEAGSSVTEAIGSRYRVALRSEQGLNIVIVRVFEGAVRVVGENFEIPTLASEQWVSLLSPPDDSFLRIKNMRGQFDVTVKGEDRQSRSLAMEEESVVKVWQRIVPETHDRVVTSVFSDPAGREVETISVTYPSGEVADFVDDIRDQTDMIPWDHRDDVVDGRPVRPEDMDDLVERRRPLPEMDNPMPSDEFMDELVELAVQDLMPGVGTPAPPAEPPVEPPPAPPFTPPPFRPDPPVQPPAPPRPPPTPTPTPVGAL